jgi:hypothetical protein
MVRERGRHFADVGARILSRARLSPETADDRRNGDEDERNEADKAEA